MPIEKIVTVFAYMPSSISLLLPSLIRERISRAFDKITLTPYQVTDITKNQNNQAVGSIFVTTQVRY